MAVALLAALTGCASRPVGKPLVWPKPPETARIRFVTTFRHTVDLDNSFWARTWRFIGGGSGGPRLSQPMGLAVSEDGNRVYVADFGLRRVLRADFADRSLDVFAPEEPMGQPFNVALDAKENVYVSDSLGKMVRVFSRSGEALRIIGKGDFERPTGLAVDRKRGRLYVVDSSSRTSTSHRVRAYTLEGKRLFDLGPAEGTGGKGGGDGQFHFPTYLAVHASGHVYVGDSMNFRIQEFDQDGKFVRKYGEHGDGPGAFARIKGLDFDGFGNLYVADGGHSNVQIFNENFDLLLFFGGKRDRLEYFDLPSAIAIDRSRNRIYVCNQWIARVNVYDLINTKAEDSIPKPEEPEAAPAPATAPK